MDILKSGRARRAVVAAVVCIITFFAHNDVLTPDIMESRNIITAREMAREGHWLVPTMNGELRLEKPPLPTWLTALAELAAPDCLALQRAAAGCAALLMAFFLWRLASRVLRIDPLPAVLLLCTCYNVILMGRTATWDIYCHAFQLGGIYLLARALLCPGRSLGYFAGAGLLTGLSIMSKGPVAPYALLLPFLVAFGAVFRPSLRGKGAGVALAAAVALVVGLWWYVYVHTAAGEAWAAVVAKESGSWLNHNVRPWWYYWQFFLEAGVWSALLLTALLLPLASRSRRGDRAWLVSALWLAASLVLLSLLPEKKPRYLLPLLIPASCVMARLLEWWGDAFAGRGPRLRGDAVLMRANAWLLAVAALAVGPAAWLVLVRPGLVGAGAGVAVCAVSAGVAAALAVAAVRLRPGLMLGAVVALFVAAEQGGMPLVGKAVGNPVMHSLALTRGDARLQGVPLRHCADEELRIELVYAAGRNIRPIPRDSIASQLPMAILTHGRAGDELPAELWQHADSTYIGRFDDNCRPPGNRLYRPMFIYHLTLLTPKAGE